MARSSLSPTAITELGDILRVSKHAFDDLLASRVPFSLMKTHLRKLYNGLLLVEPNILLIERSHATRKIYYSLREQISVLIEEPNDDIPLRSTGPVTRSQTARFRSSRQRSEPNSSSSPSNEFIVKLHQVVCEPKELCPCCLEEFENMLVTRCSHKFCEPCVINSLRRKITCPICRSPIVGSKS